MRRQKYGLRIYQTVYIKIEDDQAGDWNAFIRRQMMGSIPISSTTYLGGDRASERAAFTQLKRQEHYLYPLLSTNQEALLSK